MIADEYFDSYLKTTALEDDLFNALLQAVGLSDSTTADWFMEDCVYDFYDRSFEFLGVKDDWKPTLKQRAAFWKLGFYQCWICYDNGTERFYCTSTLLHPKPTVSFRQINPLIQKPRNCRCGDSTF